MNSKTADSKRLKMPYLAEALLTIIFRKDIGLAFFSS